jgi:SAM-dependent methyltransferase
VVPPLARGKSRIAVWAPRWLARIAPSRWKIEFDFAYSNIVFQHIPSREVIESYVREVHRLLRPGALFKFQVQGYPLDPHDLQPDDTWTGVPFSEQEACAMAERNGFEPRYRHGAGTQIFWLWYFKKP